ncbi:hypothetical protein [Sphingobacterium puteale]|uniref:hypothetical protein n=1 Tax=Sphingobacterium puteale TaxID=2420510 RepID=UPI003D9699A8
MKTAKHTASNTSKGQAQGNTNKSKSMNSSHAKSSSTPKSAENGSASKTKDELLQMAKKLEIIGRHDMSKDELIKAIDKHKKN